MKNIVPLREFKVPENVDELVDKASGEPIGSFRNMAADKGMLRELDLFAVAVLALPYMKAVFQEKDALPGGAATEQRLKDMLFSIVYAYSIGTMSLDEEDGISFGDADDKEYVVKTMKADYVQLPNGHVVEGDVFRSVIQKLTHEAEGIENILKDVKDTGVKGKIMRKEVNRVALMGFIFAGLRGAKQVMEDILAEA